MKVQRPGYRPVGPEPYRPAIRLAGFIRATAALSVLLLSACADKTPPPSADTSCERFRHISANPAQIKVFSDNWEVMESYADQVLAHNIEYDHQCLPEAKK